MEEATFAITHLYGHSLLFKANSQIVSYLLQLPTAVLAASTIISKLLLVAETPKEPAYKLRPLA